MDTAHQRGGFVTACGFTQVLVRLCARLSHIHSGDGCEEAMREVLGAGRGVQAGEVDERPAMAAEARREWRQGAEGDEEGDRGDRTHDSERA